MTSSGITLVAFGLEHIARTFEWVRDPWLQKAFLMRREPSWEAHTDHFERVLSDPSQSVYAILEEGVHVGNCGIKNICESTASGEIWIYIGCAEHRGRHIGSRATRLLCRKAFTVHGLTTVCVHVADFNETAQRMYERLGFAPPAAGPPETPEWHERGCKVSYMEIRR